jgi:hypothetical protein
MIHSPLPWRITEATEKKGREIVDARGNTVAKLTALDIPNAELMVKGVNATISDMQYITHPDQLIIGREYWLREKADSARVFVSPCKQDHDSRMRYFMMRLWAEVGNNQAMDRYDIVGPVPLGVPPDFDALKVKAVSWVKDKSYKLEIPVS